MDGSPNIPYVIVEDAAYTQKAIEILGDQRIVDEKLRVLIWVIARIPTAFSRIPGTPIFRAVYDGEPRLRVWYTFNGYQVILRFIEKYETGEIEEN